MRTYIPKATCNMSRYSNDEFLLSVERIQKKLSDVAYNNVQPSPASIWPLLEQFRVLLYESKAHNYTRVRTRNDLRNEIYNLVRIQCCSVNGLAQQDKAFLIESGFEMNKEPQSSQAPQQTNIRIIEPLQGGQAMVKYNGIKERDCYEIVVTSAQGFHQSTISMKTTTLLKGLPTNTSLYIKVRGINGKGEGEWCTEKIFSLAPETSFSYKSPILLPKAGNDTLGNYLNSGLRNASGG